MQMIIVAQGRMTVTQALTRRQRKVTEEGAPLRVGRGHQQRGVEACGPVGRQVRRGNAAQAMRQPGTMMMACVICMKVGVWGAVYQTQTTVFLFANSLGA